MKNQLINCLESSSYKRLFIKNLFVEENNNIVDVNIHDSFIRFKLENSHLDIYFEDIESFQENESYLFIDDDNADIRIFKN